MEQGFDEYMNKLRSNTEYNNVNMSSNLDEMEFVETEMDTHNVNMMLMGDENMVIDIEGETLLKSTYSQIGTSIDEVKSFNMIDELWSIIELMDEPKEGTYKSEIYKSKMFSILFNGSYDEDIKRFEQEYKRRERNL